MDIKCKDYPISLTYLPNVRLRKIPAPVRVCVPTVCAQENKSVIKRPVAAKKVIGLSAIRKGFFKVYSPVKGAVKTYKKNLKHTYEHKIFFSIIEKQLYGKNTIDSVTHDLDKMFLYTLGFPRSFVSKFHRKYSTHHVESGKSLNLRSMLVDNVASNLKEGKAPLRVYYNSSAELQEIPNFDKLLQKYNFGENIDLQEVKRIKDIKVRGIKGLAKNIMKMLSLMVIH